MVKLQDSEDNVTVHFVTKAFIWKHFCFFLKQKRQASLVNRMTAAKVGGFPSSDLRCVCYFASPNFAELGVLIYLWMKFFFTFLTKVAMQASQRNYKYIDF